MTCPKCHGDMRTYERNGVHVDQCTECRGLFLDRGELERLVEAEGSFYRDSPPPPPRQDSRGYEEPQRGYRDRPPKKRRRNFLEELFD